jgi:hypothetical protein
MWSSLWDDGGSGLTGIESEQHGDSLTFVLDWPARMRPARGFRSRRIQNRSNDPSRGQRTAARNAKL